MTSAYWASFVTRPVVITSPGLYQTRSGEIVTVEEVSGRHDFGCRGRYAQGIREGWHKSGRLYANVESGNDIVGAA